MISNFNGAKKKTSVVHSVPIDEKGTIDYAQAARDVIETMKRWFAEEYPEERAEIFILDNGPTSEFQLPIETFRFPAICQIADNLARENADNLNVKNLGRFEIVENSAILSNLFEIVSNLNCWQFGKLLKIYAFVRSNC